MGDAHPRGSSQQVSTRKRPYKEVDRITKAKSIVAQFGLLRRQLECPVCFSIQDRPRIFACVNGHVVCSDCKKKLEICPVSKCAYDSPPRRCIKVEDLINSVRLRLPCRNAPRGCSWFFRRSKISAHEKDCMFRVVACHEESCGELTTFSALSTHLRESHEFAGNVATGKKFATTLHLHMNEGEFSGREIHFEALDDSLTISDGARAFIRYDGNTFLHQFGMISKGEKKYLVMWIRILGGEEKTAKYRVTFVAANHNVNIVEKRRIRPLGIQGRGSLMRLGIGDEDDGYAFRLSKNTLNMMLKPEDNGKLRILFELDSKSKA